MRRRFALAVIALHVLLLWLLAAGFRVRIDVAREPLQFVSLWIDPPPEPGMPVESPRTAPPRKRAVAVAPSAAPPAVPVEPVAPAVPTVPVQPRPDSTAPPAVIAPSVDWGKQATLAAGRAAAAAAPKSGPADKELKIIPKPCKPKRSMEWKGDENPGIHWVGPFPVLVTKNCTITIGFVGCALGDSPPNEHLLDDMKDPNRTQSSVPDPHVCD